MKNSIRTISKLTLLTWTASAISCVSNPLALAQSEVRSDQVKLHSGQVLTGSVRQRMDGDKQTAEIIVDLADGTTLLLNRELYLNWRPEPEAMVEYREKVKQAKRTVDDQWQLATWCNENKLKEQSQIHSRIVIELDPRNEVAHKALGHFKRPDGWIDFDQQRLKLGYVKVSNKWVLPEVEEFSQALKARKDIDQAWKNDLRIWFGKASGRSRDREQTIATILAIRDPSAVPTLIERLTSVESSTQERALIVEVLTEIPTYASSSILVDFYLQNGDDPETRDKCLETILKRTDFKIAAANKFAAAVNPNYLVDGKKVTDPTLNTTRMSRAALGLRRVEIQMAIETLINALQVTYKFKTKTAGNTAFGANGQTSVAPVGRDVEFKETVQCPAALETLEAFTGQDFGYNQMAWMQWWISENTPSNLDLRRDN